MTPKIKTVCAVCDRPEKHNRLCPDCASKLDKALGDIPAIDEIDPNVDPELGVRRKRYRRSLIAELELTRTRQGRGGSITRGGNPDHVLYTDSRGSKRIDDATTRLRYALTKWSKMVAYDKHDGGPTGNTSSDVARYLRRHVRWIIAQRWADELYADIVHGVREAERVIDRVSHDSWWMGPCKAELEGGHGDRGDCEEPIYGAPDAKLVTCPACGTVWEVAERRKWLLLLAEDRLVETSLLADALSNIADRKVTESMIRGYKLRGRIMPRGLDLAGRELFRFGDVLEVVRQIDTERTRTRSRRKARA